MGGMAMRHSDSPWADKGVLHRGSNTGRYGGPASLTDGNAGGRDPAYFSGYGRLWQISHILWLTQIEQVSARAHTATSSKFCEGGSWSVLGVSQGPPDGRFL